MYFKDPHDFTANMGPGFTYSDGQNMRGIGVNRSPQFIFVPWPIMHKLIHPTKGGSTGGELLTDQSWVINCVIKLEHLKCMKCFDKLHPVILKTFCSCDAKFDQLRNSRYNFIDNIQNSSTSSIVIMLNFISVNHCGATVMRLSH